MKGLLCRLGLHRFGELHGDGAGMYRSCRRCETVKEDHSIARLPASSTSHLPQMKSDSNAMGASGF
jgi:hypothetical protein